MGGGVVLPNVSVAKDAPTTVYYNPYKFFVKLSLNNGEVVELQGSGELTNAMLSQYKLSSIVSAELGELCTSIGEDAFYDCTGLTSVTIGKGLTSIGSRALYGCSALESIIVEEGNTICDSRENCNAVIKTATNTLIAGCKNTVIPNSVTSIGYGAFSGCEGLTSITIPNSVTRIGERAFSKCRGLTSVIIGNGVTTIANDAFSGCSRLTSVTIPNSVTRIGVRTFKECTGLTNIIVDSANTVYDSRDNCNAIINTSTNELIAGCKNTIIPNTVTSIGDYAFSNCFRSASITIPNSVTSIGNEAFAYTGLTSITSLAAKAPTIQSGTFYYIKTGGRLTVPSGSSGYETWMSKGNYYLGKYNWTKVEQ